jgi:glucans biosynthesis protein C
MGAARRNDLDWLRVLATFAVLFFHCGRFFDDEGWHVKNPETSAGIGVLVQFIVIWLMPVFFVVSGQSVCHLLRAASNAKYLRTRVTRLLVPLVFGVLVLVPPQVYVERASHGQWAGSFLGFLPRYFDGWYGFGGNFAWMGLHLWYLEVLLIFSLLALPLFRFLLRRPVPGGGFGERPAAALLLGLPLVAVELLVDLQPGGLGMRAFGGWSLAVYLVLFVLGFLVARSARLRTAVERARVVALVVALAVTGLLAVLSYVPPARALVDGHWYWVRGLVRPTACWCFMVAFMGLGDVHLQQRSRFLDYANEAVLPFYMLHQTVIVVLAFGLIGWAANPWAKYVALIAASFAVIMTVYEAVRRVGPLRVLFGMKHRGA